MTRAQSDGSAVCELTCSCWHLGALYGSRSIIVVWFGGPQSMTVTDRFGKWYARGAAESDSCVIYGSDGFVHPAQRK